MQIQLTSGAAAPSNLSMAVRRVKSVEQGIILSDDVIGSYIHYVGKTMPHVDPETDCEGCRAKRPKRWEGYLVVWHPQTNKVFVLVTPAGPVKHLEAYRVAQGTLRGAALKLERANGKTNGRVTGTISRSNWAESQMPTCPDLLPVLAMMWQVPIEALRRAAGETTQQAIAKEVAQVEPIPFAQPSAPQRNDMPGQIPLPSVAEDEVLEAIERIEPAAKSGALVPVRDLSQRVNLPRPQFAAALKRLARDERLSLHRHDFPASLTEEERAHLVEDGQGSFYIGVALRRNGHVHHGNNGTYYRNGL